MSNESQKSEVVVVVLSWKWKKFGILNFFSKTTPHTNTTHHNRPKAKVYSIFAKHT